MSSDPHRPLRDDVRFLGRVLGDIIRQQAGDDLFDRVERVRGLAKGSRAGATDDFDELARELSSLTVEQAKPWNAPRQRARSAPSA